MKENPRDAEEPRGLPRVSEEEGRGAGFGDEGKRAEDDWSASGTEDPAFFIKPADGK